LHADPQLYIASWSESEQGRCNRAGWNTRRRDRPGINPCDCASRPGL